MSGVVYRTGEWQVVVEESGVAALPADASADKVVALSEMLGRRVPELTEAIDVLLGGAITGLGSFAVALIGANGTRFAVRGAVTVTTGRDESFSGEDITTWSERFIAGPARFEIGFGEAPEAAEYPIRSGVVLASGIRVGEPFDSPDEEGADDADEEGAGALPGPVAPDYEAQSAESEPVEPAAETEAGFESEPEPYSAEPDAHEDADAEPEAAGASSPDEPEHDEAPSDTIMPDELLPRTTPLDEVPTETIRPDDIADTEVAAASDDDGEGAEHDLSATIAPSSGAEFSPSSPPAPEAIVPATVAPPTPDPWAVTPPPAPGLDIGDHDGATISVAEARRLRGTTSAPDAPTEVLPVLPGDASHDFAMRIRLSTGQAVDLDRPVIIGRKPRSTRASGTSLPHLIAVESPSADISRNHLEVRPEGDSVVVIDLHTTNGSTLLRPGADPVRLHPGEQTLVLGGDVIDLGDGVTVTLEEVG
ncbi:FHA domain-containing protein [Microbacterium sp.]|uniref:FHA domain-containing protein n=1 Tax=Microbacterium sp. TaxID=51671 RepID=UPI002810EDAD|nr:FHA domain-containing protein [Microbacterium sp.]